MNSSAANVLIIDDEKDVLTALKDVLTQEGFVAHTAQTGTDGIKSARQLKPDVIVLDLRLPDLDGYDVCRILKSEPATAAIPILMLSTRSKDTEKIVGLEIGADDYLTKPYNPLELVARLRVALRRKNAAPVTVDTLQSGPVRMDIGGRIVTVDKRIVRLTKKEFDVLATLLEKPGKVFSRQALLQRVWGVDHDSFQGTIDTHVKTLRKKLGSAAAFLETVTGIGYRWAMSDADQD
jgi:DNA-binding response OmpR family regulator